MKLSTLLTKTEYVSLSGGDPEAINIKSISYNSKTVTDASLFVCIRGARADGHDFAKDAFDKGARVFITEKPLGLPFGAVLITVKNSRKALASISASFFYHPEKKLKIIGITGTKGKSTVAYMTAHILEAAGKSVGLIGTCGIKIKETTTPTGNTTPESYEIYRAFSDMVKNGCEYAVLEVSSQAIMLDRIEGDD